jgi:hypothetical protein
MMGVAWHTLPLRLAHRTINERVLERPTDRPGSCHARIPDRRRCVMIFLAVIPALMLGFLAGLLAFRAKSRWCPQCGATTAEITQHRLAGWPTPQDKRFEQWLASAPQDLVDSVDVTETKIKIAAFLQTLRASSASSSWPRP